MWNIIKAQNYQLKRDNVIWYILLLAAVISLCCLADSVNMAAGQELTGSIFTALYAGSKVIITGIIVVLIAGRISGWDYTDKTMNYEILSGHSRKEVYFGRILVTLVWCIGSAFLFGIIPELCVTMAKGWGVSMDGGDVILRYLLSLFPIFRLTCECILLTFLLKNCYYAMFFSWMLYGVSLVITEIIREMTGYEVNLLMTSGTITKLFDFGNFRIGYADGKDICVYETGLETSFVAGTIGVSLVAGIVCLLAGYMYFKKNDVH